MTGHNECLNRETKEERFLDGVCLAVWLGRPTSGLTEESLLTPAVD